MGELRHFKRFSTINDYESYIEGSPVLPNVSFVGDERDVYYKNGEPVPPGPTPHDYSRDYLTIVMLENGDISTYVDYVYYSLNNGQTWEELTDTPVVLNMGDKVLLKANHYYPPASENTFYFNGRHNVEGNILSMSYGDNFIGQTTLLSGTTVKLLYDSDLVSAENLVLPLITATTGCYYYMFGYCTSLTTAPKLPATTLEEECYSYMFLGCESLTTAPELPATTLADYCYSNMFDGCTNLNYIKCLATNIPSPSCTSNWVVDVQTTSGTFVKNPSMSDWLIDDSSGIPENWTVEDAS